MSVLCKLGIHDWEYLESVGKEQLRNNIKYDLYFEERYKNDKLRPPKPSYIRIKPEGGCRLYHKKVCLKCGKKIDEITPLKKVIEKEESEQERIQIERKNRAEVLWNNKE